MNESKILACPFCGSEEIIRAPRSGYPVQCECKKCGCEGPDALTSDEAVREWNKRAGGRQPEPSATGETKHVCISDLLDASRLKWLHDCSTGQTDQEGYEWGIYRVKWENGQAVSVLQTSGDFSDLDAEMEREKLSNKPAMTCEEIKDEWQSLSDAGNRKPCCKIHLCARPEGHPGDCVINSFAKLIPANLLRPIEASNDQTKRPQAKGTL